MLVIPSGIFTDFRPLQPENAYHEMTDTLSGTVIVVKLLQS